MSSDRMHRGLEKSSLYPLLGAQHPLLEFAETMP